MGLKAVFSKKRPVYTAGLLYTLTALIVVLSAWAEDLHRFGLDLTISRYVGLRPWTAVLYMVVAAVMVTLVFIYIRSSKMPRVKQGLYMLVFACVFGCAICPFNYAWSAVLSDMHNGFAYGLMLLVTISFVWMAVRPVNRKQRIFGIAAICYALYFIICFVIIGWEFFISTIFVWENIFIYMLLGELILEYRDNGWTLS